MREFAYESLNKSWPTKFLTSQSDLQVLATRPQNSYGSRFVLGEFSIHNRSGGAAVVGVGGRLPVSLWSFGFWDDSEYAAGTVYANDTTDAQDSDAGDVNLDTVANNADGIAIGCDVPFSIASLQVSQASANGTVWKLYYSIASLGTGFSSNYKEITNAYVMPDFSATGERLIWFEPPTDWHKVQSATAIANKHGLTVPSQYILLALATTAPNATQGQMSLATLGRMLMTKEALADNDVLTNIGGVEQPLPPQCDAICAAISVANAQNRASVSYRYAG